jgi:RimJ/RimL family protein N-acetyltransferase
MNMRNPYLIGKKIYLRPVEKEDAEAIAPWLNDPEVVRNIAHYTPMSIGAEVEYLSKPRNPETDVTLGIALSESDRLIGCAGLHKIHPKNRSAAFGIMVGEKAEWGKGYGTEATRLMTKHAFETLNLNRVELHVREHNERGIRAYERVGFQREGLLRQDTFVEGRYVNTIVMAILREEWRG